MVYISAWDEFVEKSVLLFRADPENTRYQMKYRNCDGKLVLKVTDNKEWKNYTRCCFLASCDMFDPANSGALKACLNFYLLRLGFSQILCSSQMCLKYKTDQAQDAKKMEKLNNIFFTLMARGPEVDLSEVTGKEQAEAQPAKRGRGRKH